MGSGGLGNVYQGTYQNGLVAVKSLRSYTKIEVSQENSMEVIQAFQLCLLSCIISNCDYRKLHMKSFRGLDSIMILLCRSMAQ